MKPEETLEDVMKRIEDKGRKPEAPPKEPASTGKPPLYYITRTFSATATAAVLILLGINLMKGKIGGIPEPTYQPEAVQAAELPPTLYPTNEPYPTIGSITQEPTLIQAPTTAPYSPPQDLPLRERIQTSIGTGVLSDVTYSDGMAQISQSTLDQTPYHIQLINPHTTQGLCGISQFDVDTVWFSNSAPTQITVNGAVIGGTDKKTGPHGYLFKYNLKKGDEICVTTQQPTGYALYFGPTINTHYDSYCYRGWCK